jgi:hypothetical protein
MTARVFPLPLVECKIFRSTPQLISVLDILIPGPTPGRELTQSLAGLAGRRLEGLWQICAGEPI